MMPSLSNLHSPREPERLEALRELVRHPDAAHASELADLFVDPAPRVRELAVAALKAIGESALPVVLPWLESPEPAIRALSLEVAKAAGSDGLTHLLPLLASPDKDLRRFAVEAIAPNPHSSVADHLLEASHDPDANVRVAAIEALGARHCQVALPRLITLVAEDGPYMLHLAVIQALVDLHAVEALDRIVSRARSNPLYTLPALGAWATLGTEASFPEVFELTLRHGKGAYPAMLAAASQVLSRGEPLAPDYLDALKSLSHGVEADRATLPMLLRLDPARVLDLLPGQLHDETMPSEIEDLLARQPELLVPLLEHPAVLALLSRLLEEGRLSLLLPEALRQGLAQLPLRDPHQALLLAHLLETLALPDLGDRLVELARHADPSIATCGMRALGRLRDPRTVEVALAAFHCPEPELWYAAEHALSLLADPQIALPLEELVVHHRGSERGLCALGALVSLGKVPERLFEEFLGHRDTEIRRRAASMRLKAGGVSSGLLTSLVNDPDATIRFVTIRYLARAQGPRRLDLLAYALQNDPESENRREVLSALIAWQDPAADHVVSELLSGLDAVRAQEALDAALELCEPECFKGLERLAALGNPVARAALDGLEDA